MIATWGGTTTRLAKRPPIIPKFERVIVAPRSSSGGIERAAASARMRLRPVRKSALSRSPTLRSTGTKSPPSRSTAMPTSTRLSKRRSPASALYQALSDGSALHAAAIACTSRIVISVSFDQASISASSITVVGTTCACANAMRCAIARRLPLSGSAGPASVKLRAARSTSARVIIRHEVEIDIELARQGPNRGEHLQALRASGRLDLARRFAALNLADDCAGVRTGALAILNQRGADLNQIALCAESARDGSAPR